MLFNIQDDFGDRVVGYFVPDSYSGIGEISISAGGTEILRTPTFEERSALVQAGRHATGVCGFTLDESRIPGLSSLHDLEICDADSGILIYRRRSPDLILPRKLFRIETHLLPLWRLDSALEPHFHYFYKGVERFGSETSTQIFLMNKTQSSFASGRIFFKTFEYYIDQGFQCLMVLQDPYEELAERLIIMRQVASQGSEFLGLRDNISLETAIAYVADINLDDDRSLKRALKTMPNVVASVLTDPVVRQLTARTGDEMPTRLSIASALHTLSSFEVVGLRSSDSLFTESLAAILGLPDRSLPPLPPLSGAVELGRRLRDLRFVEALLDHDLQLFEHVRSAIEKSRHAATAQA